MSDDHGSFREVAEVRVGPEAFGAEVPMHVVATLGAGTLVPGFRVRGFNGLGFRV